MRAPYLDDGDVRLYQGDVLDVLREMDAESVQTCVTSPPYWALRDYGEPGQIGLEPTPEEYVAAMVGVFREVRRVLRDDGTLWLNLGDSYAPNRGDGYMPSRDASAHGLKHKDLVGIPWRVAFALQDDGWWLRSDIIWAKPNPMPESVTDRPTKAHEYLFLLTKRARYFYDAQAIQEKSVGEWNSARAFSPNGRRAAEGQGAGGSQWNGTGTHADKYKSGRNARSVWTITTKAFSGAHFATFPPEIPSRCIQATSRAGDVVLDPFSGAATTALVARGLGRRAVGIDLNPEYLAISADRLKQLSLLSWVTE